MLEPLTNFLSPTQWAVGIAVVLACALGLFFHFRRPPTELETPPPDVPVPARKAKPVPREEVRTPPRPETPEDFLSTYPPFNRRGGGSRVVKHERRRNHTLFDETDPHTAAILGALSALSTLVDNLAKERRKELTERNNERFSVALDYLIDFEQLLEQEPVPNLLELNPSAPEADVPQFPPFLHELSNRKCDPEIMQQELLALSQSMLPLIKNETSNISLLSVLERLNLKLREHEDAEDDEPQPLSTPNRPKEDVFL